MKLKNGRRLHLCTPVPVTFSGVGWSCPRPGQPSPLIDVTVHHTNDEYPRRRVQLEMSLDEAEQLLGALTAIIARARSEEESC